MRGHLYSALCPLGVGFASSFERGGSLPADFLVFLVWERVFMVHVQARAGVKAQYWEAYVKILEDLVPRVRQEKGCLRYVPCVDVDGGQGNVVTMVETWESQEDLEAHLQGPNIAEFRRRIAGMREEGSSCLVLRPLIP